MKKITKAVIPAAGLGTRLLPISRTVPKEILPIVDRPSMEYLVREAVESGITDILIITGRNKEAIENYFDYSVEYKDVLAQKGKKKELDDMNEVCSLANIYFLRQKETKGLGHAVLCAEKFIGDEPFAVLYGDDVMCSEKPVTKQLCEVYEKSVVGVAEVPYEDLKKYCSMKAEPIDERTFMTTDMVEKPQTREEAFSNLSILGRVVLTPDIFEVLKHTEPGKGGELQLTDAMKQLARTVGVISYKYEGKRYDMGSKFGFLQANIETALKHPELKDDLTAYLKELCKNL